MITIQCIKGKKLFFSLPESELQKAIPDITHTNTHTVSLLLYCSLTLLKRSICQCCRFCLCCSQVSLIVQLTETINLSVSAAGSASAALRSASLCSLQKQSICLSMLLVLHLLLSGQPYRAACREGGRRRCVAWMVGRCKSCQKAASKCSWKNAPSSHIITNFG